MALATQRVEDRFGTFVRQGSVDDQAARFSLVEDDVNEAVIAACIQVGYKDATGIYNAIANNFVTSDATPRLRTAGVRHEARKPKMCPYHSEVTDISLAAGDPQAGYNSMSSHAWSDKHCQGGDYEGGKCNFKPAMVTQTFWDEKAEKAEQRREERQQQEEAQPVEQLAPVTELHEVETPEADFVDGVAEYDSLDSPETVEHNEPSAVGEGIPMSMAAKTATETTGLKGPEPKMDKRKWTPKTVPHDQPLKADDPNGRNPTKRKDVVEPITQTPDTPDNKGELKEIGEQVTEHQDVTQKGGPAKTDQGGTFGGGERSAVSSLLSQDAVRQALAKIKRD
jgi:hypothetical protein